MKKILLTSIAVCLTFLTVFSQDTEEMLVNGTIEDTLSAPWGAYAADAADVDAFRSTDFAYEGDFSARIWDHTWGVFLWNDVPGFTDSAEYTFSFWYKGDISTSVVIAIGRDMGYDLVTDPNGLVPDTASVVALNEVENAAIQWVLDPRDDWKFFSYTWAIDWFGIDPESGQPISAVCAFMFQNVDYAADAFDGPSAYFDKVSMTKTSQTGTVGIHQASPSLIHLFPNPTRNQIQIEGVSSISSLYVVNMAGQRVLEFQSPGKLIDVSSLQPGVYYMRIISEEDEYAIGKFIKE